MTYYYDNFDIYVYRNLILLYKVYMIFEHKNKSAVHKKLILKYISQTKKRNKII